MTEKRFTFEIKTRGNKAYTQWYDDGKPINSAETVVDLLNELNDENKKLKQVNEMLQMDFTMTERNLMEENEQLKQETQQVKDILKEYDDFEFFVDSAIAIGFIERIAWAVGMELEE